MQMVNNVQEQCTERATQRTPSIVMSVKYLIFHGYHEMLHAGRRAPVIIFSFLSEFKASALRGPSWRRHSPSGEIVRGMWHSGQEAWGRVRLVGEDVEMGT